MTINKVDVKLNDERSRWMMTTSVLYLIQTLSTVRIQTFCHLKVEYMVRKKFFPVTTRLLDIVQCLEVSESDEIIIFKYLIRIRNRVVVYHLSHRYRIRKVLHLHLRIPWLQIETVMIYFIAMCMIMFCDLRTRVKTYLR